MIPLLLDMITLLHFMGPHSCDNLLGTMYHGDGKAPYSITRRQNFRQVQNESNCRQYFKVHLK